MNLARRLNAIGSSVGKRSYVDEALWWKKPRPNATENAVNFESIKEQDSGLSKNPYWQSPNGVIVWLKSNKFSQTFEVKRQDIGNFGDGDQSLVFGANAEVYPVNAVFFGENHSTQALTFFKELKVKGTSLLQLPYGELKFVVVDRVSLSYDLVKGVGITRVEVVFVEDTQIAPTDKGIIKLNIIKSSSFLNDAEDAISNSFAEGLDIVSVTESNSVVDRFTQGVSNVKSSLQPVLEKAQADTGAIGEAITNFNTIGNSIVNNITEVVSQPLVLANQVMRLKEIPARAMGNASSIRASYKEMLESSLPNLFATGFGIRTREQKNSVVTQGFFGGVALLGMADSLLNVEYETKQEAYNSIDAILESYEEYLSWLENAQKEFEEARRLAGQFLIDTNASKSINIAIKNVVGSLLEASLNLKREFVFELSLDTTILNIAREFYPEMLLKDEQEKTQKTLEYIISTNNLKDDEILLLPKGKKVVVYI